MRSPRRPTASPARAAVRRSNKTAVARIDLDDKTVVSAAHRAARNPSLLCFILVAAGALGASMVGPLLQEAAARRNGIWLRVECEIIDHLLIPELVKLAQMSHSDTDLHTGKQRWRFVGGYNVTVRIGDGCDGDLGLSPAPLSNAERSREEEEEATGFYVYHLNGSSLPSQPRPRRAPPSSPPPPHSPPARARRLQTVHLDATAATEAAHQQACEAAQAMLSRAAVRHELRAGLLGQSGGHVAFNKLARAQADYCEGPVDTPEDASRQICADSAHSWFKHYYPSGTEVPCWLFEQKVARSSQASAQAGGATDEYEVHVVIDRSVPLSTFFYLLYLVLVAAFAFKLALLLVRRWMRTQGLLPPEQPLGSTSDMGVHEAEAQRAARLSLSDVEFAEQRHAAADAVASASLQDGASTRRSPARRGQAQPQPQPKVAYTFQRGGSYGRALVPELAAPPPEPRPSVLRSPGGWLRRQLIPSREVVEWRGRRDTLSDPIGLGIERPDKLIMMI